MISKTPEPPYYAVIFSSLQREGDFGYAAASEKMMALAEQQTGLKGIMDLIQASPGLLSIPYPGQGERLADGPCNIPGFPGSD